LLQCTVRCLTVHKSACIVQVGKAGKLSTVPLQQVQAACWLCPGWRRVSDRRPESTARPHGQANHPAIAKAYHERASAARYHHGSIIPTWTQCSWHVHRLHRMRNPFWAPGHPRQHTNSPGHPICLRHPQQTGTVHLKHSGKVDTPATSDPHRHQSQVAGLTLKAYGAPALELNSPAHTQRPAVRQTWATCICKGRHMHHLSQQCMSKVRGQLGCRLRGKLNWGGGGGLSCGESSACFDIWLCSFRYTSIPQYLQQ
jgi:hypothetical protein